MHVYMMLRNYKVFATSELGKPSHETISHRCSDIQACIFAFVCKPERAFANDLLGLGAFFLPTTDRSYWPHWLHQHRYYLP